jgi:hypothetical protein
MQVHHCSRQADMIHCVLRVCILHYVVVFISVVRFITNQHYAVIDFEPPFIGGVESQFIQIFRNGGTVIGPTHGKIR